MKRIQLIFVLLLFVKLACQGQSFEKVILPIIDNDNLYVNDNESNELYYLKLIPNNPKGAIVLLPPSGETTQDLIKQVELPQLAYELGIATIIPSINWGTENRKAEIEVLDFIFEQVIAQHSIPINKFVMGGLSNGGMISLTYTQQSVKEKGSTYLIPCGVFALDTPLDKAHLYHYCEREIKRNFSEAGVYEAQWIIDNYNKVFGGSPHEFPEKYIESSIYSYGVEQGGNAKYLKNIPIRMYTDLDVNWLLIERRRDLYDWNGTDIVAMINDLKLMGN